MDDLPPYRYWIAVALLCALAGLAFFCLPSWTVDDAYISYRYAHNWVAEGQLAWNLNEAPVEGFTGYALVLLAAACLRLGIAPETGLDVVGILAALATLPMLAALLPRLGISRPLVLVLVLVYALSPAFYLHGGSGLETSLFTCGIVAWLLWLTGLQEGRPMRQGLLGLLLCAALVLLRPEGLVFAGLAGIVYVREVILGRIWLALFWPLAFVGIFVAAFVWRFQHFGTWLPNTFWAKHHTGLIAMESVKDALRFAAYYLLLPLGAGALLCYMDPEAVRQRLQQTPPLQSRTTKRLLLLSGIAAVAVLLSYFRAHLYMNYAGRFFFPLLPIGLLFAGVTLQAGWENYQAFRLDQALRARLARWTLLVFAGVQLLVLAYKWRSETAWLHRYEAIVTQQLIPLGQDLQQRFPAGGRLICYMDAGAIPYFSGLRCTDFGRLNDAFLPTQTQGSQACIDYFFDQQADAIVMTSFDRKAVRYTDEAQAILDDPRFSAYQLQAVYAAEGVDDYFQFLFLQKIVP
jgi:hypothetical protein